jgi:hypothetical protein
LSLIEKANAQALQKQQAEDYQKRLLNFLLGEMARIEISRTKISSLFMSGPKTESKIKAIDSAIESLINMDSPTFLSVQQIALNLQTNANVTQHRGVFGCFSLFESKTKTRFTAFVHKTNVQLRSRLT